MKELKNKDAMAWMYRYVNSRDYELWDVYGSCSYAKRRSYEAIKQRMLSEGGHDLRILSHNAMMYTCAYVLDNDLIIETHRNTYIIKDYINY